MKIEPPLTVLPITQPNAPVPYDPWHRSPQHVAEGYPRKFDGKFGRTGSCVRRHRCEEFYRTTSSLSPGVRLGRRSNVKPAGYRDWESAPPRRGGQQMSSPSHWCSPNSVSLPNQPSSRTHSFVFVNTPVWPFHSQFILAVVNHTKMQFVGFRGLVASAPGQLPP
jgi:hypothetical protein